jgi:pimeloyl-ACP methyl ester carboxylesterase
MEENVMKREDRVMKRQLLIFVPLMLAAVCSTGCLSPEPSSPEPSTETMGPVSGMAPVNGIELYYEIHGQGTPLILLHGGLGHTGHWAKQVPVLAGHYKVIAVDSRGHGRSTMTEEPISYALMASDVVALMDFLEVEKAHVLGLSDGGIIGLHLAITRPERLIRVIASGANYSPSGIRPDAGQHPKMVEYFGRVTEEYQVLSPEPTKWEALLGNIGQMWASEPNFTVEQLNSITVPVMFLEGENEEFIYPEHTSEMAGLIPTATLVFVSGAGHFSLWEKPDEMNRAILDFLAQ